MPKPVLPIWPGWHTMPATPAIHWSPSAREALRPELAAETSMVLAGLELPLVPSEPMSGEDIWQSILEFYRTMPKRPAYEPLMPDLRTYICPGCGRPEYGPGYCGWCAQSWAATQARKAPTLNVINIAP